MISQVSNKKSQLSSGLTETGNNQGSRGFTWIGLRKDSLNGPWVNKNKDSKLIYLQCFSTGLMDRIAVHLQLGRHKTSRII